MTVPAVLAIAGVVVLLVGILGGGIRAKEIEIPTVPPLGRLMACAIGFGLIGMAIWMSSPRDPLVVSPTELPATPMPLTPEGTETLVPSTPESPEPAFPDPNKVYIIRSVATQKVLDFDGMAIIQSEWTSETHQEWIFEPLHAVDEGYYLIHSAQNGDCFDVSNASLQDTSEVVLYGCNGMDNQKWRITLADSGVVYLEAKHSRKVLDLPNGSHENGVHLIQYSFHGGENQQWILTPITP